MGLIRKTTTMLTALTAALATGLIATPAHAAGGNGGGTGTGGTVEPNLAIICDPGSGYYTWTSVAKPWKVTHASRYEHYTTGSGTYTKTAAFRLQLSAGISYSYGGSAGVQTPIASLGVETNLTLKASGSTTSTSSVSITEQMNNYAAYVFYDGHRRASGYFDYHQCNNNGTAESISSSGEAHSFNTPTTGALDCTTTPPSGSLGAAVKPLYC